MRKTALIILMAFAAVYSHAQTAYDALLFSENNYEGTARTLAMGNAFTALGGDLGSVTINPAGSAIAGYSQITLTPSLTFSASTTQGVMPPNYSGSLPYFEKEMRSSITRFSMPNLGVTMNFDTHRTSGLKNVTVGFIMNKSAGWDEDTYAAGTNNSTSFMGAMAYEASAGGYYGADLGANNAYDFMPWKPVTGYQSGMISTFGGYDDQFVGASEVIYDNGDIALGGPLSQSYGRNIQGGKYDYVFNLGANISDFIYLGANLAVSSLDYAYDEYFKESAIDPSDFEIVMSNGDRLYFKDMNYKYSYSATGSGYYGKIGVIITPGYGFRFGAAIQTPTVNRITEEWYMDGETTYTNANYNAYAKSPYGSGSYTMVSPLRANFGLAYTIGKLAVISADYEMCDFGQMKYTTNGTDRDYFEEVNRDIRDRFGISNIVRIGAEVKPVSAIAIRAGYRMATSPEIYDSWGEKLPVTSTQNVSFGLGYSSKNSFFADFALRKTIYADEYFMPYSDYMYDEDGNIISEAYAPQIINKKSLWKVLITFGWRF